VSLGVFLFGMFYVDDCLFQDMIKVSCLELLRTTPFHLVNYRGPYFKDYFNQPSRAQIGTMVAILEVGAFCKFVWKLY
jgi:hypothetical protein